MLMIIYFITGLISAISTWYCVGYGLAGESWPITRFLMETVGVGETCLFTLLIKTAVGYCFDRNLDRTSKLELVIVGITTFIVLLDAINDFIILFNILTQL